MAVIHRNITGPLKDATDTLIASATLKAKLLSPLVDDDTFISPENIEVTVTDGVFTLSLAAPANYEFTLVSLTGDTLWNFQAPLDDTDADISIAELFSASQNGESADISTAITNFLALLDTPSSFAGQAGKTVVVNATEDGIEFV